MAISHVRAFVVSVLDPHAKTQRENAVEFLLTLYTTRLSIIIACSFSGHALIGNFFHGCLRLVLLIRHQHP